MSSCSFTVNMSQSSSWLFTTWRNMGQYNLQWCNPLPIAVLEKHKNFNSYVDTMHVNVQPFLVTKSGKLIFWSSTKLMSRSESNLLDAIHWHCDKYYYRGFNITDIHAENESTVQSVLDSLQPADFHIYTKSSILIIVKRMLFKMKLFLLVLALNTWIKFMKYSVYKK